MGSNTPTSKCTECGRENISPNHHAQEIWEMCRTCNRYTRQHMVNIARQNRDEEVINLVIEDPVDRCSCGHTMIEHSHISGLCMVCDCEYYRSE